MRGCWGGQTVCHQSEDCDGEDGLDGADREDPVDCHYVFAFTLPMVRIWFVSIENDEVVCMSFSRNQFRSVVVMS
jgi:hypothetical protein